MVFSYFYRNLLSASENVHLTNNTEIIVIDSHIKKPDNLIKILNSLNNNCTAKKSLLK